MMIKEADVFMSSDPFNGSVVGAELLADPWIIRAIDILENRSHKDKPDNVTLKRGD